MGSQKIAGRCEDTIAVCSTRVCQPDSKVVTAFEGKFCGMRLTRRRQIFFSLIQPRRSAMIRDLSQRYLRFGNARMTRCAAEKIPEQCCRILLAALSCGQRLLQRNLCF